MIDSASFTNLAATTIILNDDNIPFTRFDVRREIRSPTVNKALEHGSHPTFTYMGHMEIEIEGDLFGQTSTDYNNKRMALVGALFPPLVAVRGKLGTLTVQFTGMGEAYSADVTLMTSPELPLEAMSPSRSKYMIQFKSFSPYWYGASSGNPVLF